MNKKNLLWIAISAIFPAVFNAVVFMTADTHTDTFWTSYAFIHFAYFILLIMIFSTKKKSCQSFMGYPLIGITWVFFLLESAIGIGFIVYREASFKTAFIPQIIVAAIFGIVLISNILANDKDELSDGQNRNEVLFMKNAIAELDLLYAQIKDQAFKKKFEKTSDTFRSGQIKSDPSLAGLENNLLICINNLKVAVNEKDYSNGENILEEIDKIQLERNSRIMLSKK